MTDITDTTISRRRALQAGVGAGVGLVAWSGATITSIQGTPAYAAVCTSFTYSFSATNLATAQSCVPFDYQNSPPLGVKLGQYDWNLPNGKVQCANVPGAGWTFSFPSTDTCKITVMVHRNHFTDQTVVIGAKTVAQGPGPSLTFYMPSAGGQTKVEQGCPFTPQFLAGNVSPTFWSVWINCVRTTNTNCDLPDIPTPGPAVPSCTYPQP